MRRFTMLVPIRPSPIIPISKCSAFLSSSATPFAAQHSAQLQPVRFGSHVIDRLLWLDAERSQNGNHFPSGNLWRAPWLVAWDPSQVAAHNVDGESCGHEERAHPEAPVAVHPLPIGPRTRFTLFATVSFVVVPVTCHIASIFSCAPLFLSVATGYGFGVTAALT